PAARRIFCLSLLGRLEGGSQIGIFCFYLRPIFLVMEVKNGGIETDVPDRDG
ncbi:MAG: hypothetical protein H6Q42_1752, partial [Deltaproteobacteria bacterium]|nr:hypothetical protein [Deltaproteobacteria bacterium]